MQAAHAEPESMMSATAFGRLMWIAQTDKQDAIRMYAKAGLQPILLYGIAKHGGCMCRSGLDCSNAGKHPVHGGWQKEPLDVDRIDRALIGDWRFNIGLRMGDQPGGFRLVAIDVDGPRELLDPLEMKMGKLPPTLTSKSARGLHLIFRVDPSLEIKNAVKLSKGVDIRSVGGQIVAPPSIHKSGAKYRWLDCRPPEMLP